MLLVEPGGIVIAMNKSPARQLNGMAVSRETADRLDIFASLFQKWAKTINLVAPSTVKDLWSRHIADSAQIYQLAPGKRQWVDIGSGGGFPGVITAIFLAELHGGWVHLVESNHKKAAFLRTALIETGARGSVHAIRIEDAPNAIPEADAISARAVADLSGLLTMVGPWADRNPDLRCYFHKGRDYQSEIRNTHGRWAYDLVKHASKIEIDSVILEISHLKRVND